MPFTTGEKRIPERQCIACRLKRPKTELIRVVCSPEGKISIDSKRNLPGRGAYICPNASCLKKAQKIGAFSRALRRSVNAELFELLVTEMEALND